MILPGFVDSLKKPTEKSRSGAPVSQNPVSAVTKKVDTIAVGILAQFGAWLTSIWQDLKIWFSQAFTASLAKETSNPRKMFLEALETQTLDNLKRVEFPCDAQNVQELVQEFPGAFSTPSLELFLRALQNFYIQIQGAAPRIGTIETLRNQLNALLNHPVYQTLKTNRGFKAQALVEFLKNLAHRGFKAQALVEFLKNLARGFYFVDVTGARGAYVETRFGSQLTEQGNYTVADLQAILENPNAPASLSRTQQVQNFWNQTVLSHCFPNTFNGNCANPAYLIQKEEGVSVIATPGYTAQDRVFEAAVEGSPLLYIDHREREKPEERPMLDQTKAFALRNAETCFYVPLGFQEKGKPCVALALEGNGSPLTKYFDDILGKLQVPKDLLSPKEVSTILKNKKRGLATALNQYLSQHNTDKHRKQGMQAVIAIADAILNMALLEKFESLATTQDRVIIQACKQRIDRGPTAWIIQKLVLKALVTQELLWSRDEMVDMLGELFLPADVVEGRKPNKLPLLLSVLTILPLFQRAVHSHKAHSVSASPSNTPSPEEELSSTNTPRSIASTTSQGSTPRSDSPTFSETSAIPRSL